MKAFRVAQIMVCLPILILVACSHPPKNPNPSAYRQHYFELYPDNVEEVKAAADAGDPHAMYFIAVRGSYEHVLPKGQKDWPLTQEEKNAYLIRAAEYKHADAEHKVAQNYREGLHGFPKDYAKVIYWEQRAVCDHGYGNHGYLASLYGENEPDGKWIRAEERALVKPNISLAYAHSKMSVRKYLGFYDYDSERQIDMVARMTPQQMQQAELVIRMIRNGGCPYSPCGISNFLDTPIGEDPTCPNAGAK